MKFQYQSLSAKLYKALPIIIVVIGIFARINVYVYNRTLFIDEANLARNVVEKSIPDYFDSLDYEQYAPPLFLVETKLVTAILGVRDYSFRLIPLLSGIACLVLMWLLLREWVEEDIGRIYALGLLSFSILAIRYGTEFKQYSSDALLALLLIWLANRDKPYHWDWTRVIYWLMLGAAAIWYSMPVVFVLSGIGLYFLLVSAKSDVAKILIVGAGWLMSFGVYYYFVLSKDVFDSNLQNHHADYFIRLFTFSGDAWSINGELLVTLFKSITDKTAIPVVFGLLSFLLGVYALLKSNRSAFILLIVPLLTLLLASSVQMYSLIPRMTLFALPLMMLVMGNGLSFIWGRANKILKVVLAGLVILTLINREGYKYTYTSMEIEDLKSSLHRLQSEIKPQDSIYVHHEAVPAFDFYNNLSDQPFHLSNVHLATWKNTPKKYYTSKDRKSNYFLVFCHSTEDMVLEAINSLDTLGNIMLIDKRTNSSIYKLVK